MGYAVKLRLKPLVSVDSEKGGDDGELRILLDLGLQKLSKISSQVIITNSSYNLILFDADLNIRKFLDRLNGGLVINLQYNHPAVAAQQTLTGRVSCAVS